MEHAESIVIKLKEGAVLNYIEAMKQILGGTYQDNIYSIKRGRTDISFYYCPIVPGFDMHITSSTHYQTIELIREPKDDPDVFHFYLLKEGQVEQKVNKQQQYVEASTSTGVFINNGLFPINVHFPPNLTLKAVGFRITRESLQKLIPEAGETIGALFSSEEPIAYHTHLPHELQNLMEDIFHFKQNEFGRIPLVVARGLELFTILMKTVRKLVNKDELHGLHIDDYNRLLKLKDHLLSSFDQRINIEELAGDFGISVSKLKRDFKTLFNTSVYRFYTHAKMDEAHRRLKTGKFTVMEVGYDLGYQNLSKFSLMFKKIKGINPKDVLPL